MKKKAMAVMMAVFTAAALMAGCGQKAEDASAQGAAAQPGSAEASEAASGETDTYVIGVTQFAEHGSLDNCREGFLAGLAEAGIEEGVNLTVQFDNAQADTATAGLIAYNAAMETEIPVIYTAISDPVSAGIAGEDKMPAGNITGTADTLPVKEQLEMIREILPDAKTIGILYTTSEENSLSTIETYKELAGSYGFEIEALGINTLADVDLAAAELAGKADCISNLTDNTVVQGLQTVLAKAEAAGIPVFGSEVEQVKNGCLAAQGIDYTELGKQTGKMAAKVLKGEAKASEMPFETCEGAKLYLNTKTASDLGIGFPEGYAEKAAEVFDTIGE